MIEQEGERYHTALSAAKFLGVPRNIFYDNVRGLIQGYRIEPRKRVYYRESDLKPFKCVQPVQVEVAA